GGAAENQGSTHEKRRARRPAANSTSRRMIAVSPRLEESPPSSAHRGESLTPRVNKRSQPRKGDRSSGHPRAILLLPPRPPCGGDTSETPSAPMRRGPKEITAALSRETQAGPGGGPVCVPGSK